MRINGTTNSRLSINQIELVIYEKERIRSKDILRLYETSINSNSEELHLYADAIYSAMIWGRDIDRKNNMIQEKCTSVK